MLARSLHALNAANASCAAAASINFEQAKTIEKYQVRAATADEHALLSGDEAKHPALQEGAKLKAVLAALAGLVDAGSEDEETVRDMEEESEALAGEIAELKAQLVEVTSESYVASRVDDEVSAQRSERAEEERRAKAAEAEGAKLREDIKAIDAKLAVFKDKKRKREEAEASGGSEADKEQAEITRMEREILAQDSRIADLEAAAQAERASIERAVTQRQAEESEVRLVKRALAAKRAQAEARLESCDEYQKLMTDIEEARKAAEQREEEEHVVARHVQELRGGFAKLIEGMAAKGHAAASTLRILTSTSEPVPMQKLKEELAAHLAAVGTSQKGYEGQQVLEAVYSLVSASLIQIDRTSPQQLVKTCL